MYDASKDSPQLYPSINSHSFMIVWSVCSAPVPCMEDAVGGTTTALAISQGKRMLSREPQNCNVSCVGTYYETPTPVFCVKESVPINVQGSLSQVSILPFTASPTVTDWPALSYPLGVGDVMPIYNNTTIPNGTATATNTSGLLYVDLPRSGQQPFMEDGSAASTLQIGTLSTQE